MPFLDVPGGDGWFVSETYRPAAATDDDEWAALGNLAVQVLWALTGRQFGLTDRTYAACWSDLTTGTCWVPWWGDWAPWWDGLGSPVTGAFWCNGGEVFRFPPPCLPVSEVTSVLVEGGELDPVNYRFDPRVPQLVRVDGLTWPSLFSVAFKQGVPVDSVGSDMASLLAAEFFASVTGADCSLPPNATQIVRNGVTIDLVALFEEDGKTGVGPVDLWVSTINPHRVQEAAEVITPELLRVKARLQ